MKNTKAIKLYPACKNYIWGGDRLIKKYGKKCDDRTCAESWELSFHPDGLTRTADGKTLSETLTQEQLGENCGNFPYFPVLVKLIDAKSDLSVQVHPSDEYADSHGLGYGKTEMWYVVDAEPGACLYIGFNEELDDDKIKKAADDGTLQKYLNKVEVKPGDAFLIPAGTVHAIGAGCLICEIQQNSNITYRLYDYNRKDKNGSKRELHTDQALAVINKSAGVLRCADMKTDDGNILFATKYFTAYKLDINGRRIIKSDKGSFRCITCVSGEGEIDGGKINAGDSFFIPADEDEYVLSGEMTLIMTAVRKYAVGIDLGGTFIKGGIADDLGNIIVYDKVATEAEKGDKAVAKNISDLCISLLKAANMTAADVCGAGMGVPGMIDSKNGEVVYANNLRWTHFKISDSVTSRTGLKVMISNDANVAALGEAKFGEGKGCKNTVMLTLGTGVGGGIVLDGKLYEGNASAGAELGHVVIVKDGLSCSCGRRGCLEAYASASALVRDTKRAVAQHPDSKMSEVKEIDGTTAFRYRDTDPYAKDVLDKYFSYLACGIIDFANVFRPEKVILGGGICAEGEGLTAPLQAIVDSEIYGGNMGPAVKITTAKLGNKAGILGAAALVFGN